MSDTTTPPEPPITTLSADDLTGCIVAINARIADLSVGPGKTPSPEAAEEMATLRLDREKLVLERARRVAADARERDANSSRLLVVAAPGRKAELNDAFHHFRNDLVARDLVSEWRWEK